MNRGERRREDEWQSTADQESLSVAQLAQNSLIQRRIFYPGSGRLVVIAVQESHPPGRFENLAHNCSGPAMLKGSTRRLKPDSQENLEPGFSTDLILPM